MKFLTTAQYKKAKLKFLVAYGMSTALFLFVFALVWPTKASDKEAQNAVAALSTGSAGFGAVDAQLIASWNKLEQNPVIGTEADKKNAAAAAAILEKLLDSIENTNEPELLADEQRQLMASIRLALENRQAWLLQQSQLQQQLAAVKDNQSRVVTTTSDDKAAIAALKSALAKKEEQLTALQNRQNSAGKDNIIASLQAQVDRLKKGSAAKKTPGEEEWKKKYNNINSHYKELNTAYDALSKAYQNVVAKNQRLLSQRNAQN